MLSSPIATTRSSATPPPPKKIYKGGHKHKKEPKAKKWKSSGKGFYPSQHYHNRQHRDPPEHAVLLHRLSLPSSSPSSSSGGLLERIGGPVEDDDSEAMTVEDSSDRNHADSPVLQGLNVHANLPFSVTPKYYYTPEPGEVERFLESVIGAPPAPPSPPTEPVYTYLVDSKPAPSLDLPVDLGSSAQAAASSLPSPDLMPDHCSLLGDAMASPPMSALEECRKHLASVLLASAKARGSGNSLDSEQCFRLLSDDHCRSFFQQAQETRLQLDSLVSRRTPMNQGWSGSMKRDRDDVDAWVRNTRSRFNSANTVVSDVSRKDSDITLVDFYGSRSPPKAPRAMLQASQGPLNSAQSEAPYGSPVQVASAIAEDHCPLGSGPASFINLVQQAIETFPSPVYQPATQMDPSNASMGQSTGDASPGQDPSQMVSPTQPASSCSTDCTQPGEWFKRRGSQYAEIVDVDIEVTDEMFNLSCDRQPFRLRMHLRLCSVPVGAVMKNDNDTLGGVIDHHVPHWPKKGKLVVQVNPESERSKTWLPYALESDPLDVTSCILPGKNTFRFIQLADLSEFAFVLVASPLPSEEEWRDWDWASSLDPSRATSLVTDDDGLSEFARLPVVVRS